MYVCVWMCVCVYVCKCVCMYMCMCVCMYVCIHVYVCVHVCMHMCMHVSKCVGMYVCVSVCMYICVSVCMYVVSIYRGMLCCVVWRYAFAFDSLGRSAAHRRCYLRVVDLFLSTCCMHACFPAVHFALPVCLPACFIQSVWRCISCIEL